MWPDGRMGAGDKTMPQRKAREGAAIGQHTFFRRGRKLGSITNDDLPDPLGATNIVGTVISAASLTVLTTATLPNATFNQGGNTTHDGDFLPYTDSTYNLGEDSTPLRWADLHIDRIVFNDATELTTAPTGTNPLEAEWTAGEALSQGDLVYVSGADTVSKVTTSTDGKAIGRAQENISSSSTGTILMYGPLAVISSGGAVTAGDFVVSGATAGRGYSGGTTRLSALAGSVSVDNTNLQAGIPAAHTHSLNGHTHTIDHGHGFSSSSTGSNHQHSNGSLALAHQHSDTFSVDASTAKTTFSTPSHSHSIPASPHAAGTTGSATASSQADGASHAHGHGLSGSVGNATTSAVTGSTANDGGHNHSSSTVTSHSGSSGGNSDASGGITGTTYTVSLSTHTHDIGSVTSTPPEILGIAKNTVGGAGTTNLTIVMIRL